MMSIIPVQSLIPCKSDAFRFFQVRLAYSSPAPKLHCPTALLHTSFQNPTPFSMPNARYAIDCLIHVPLNHDFNILFRFSFLFNLSTRFLCIVSASFS
jgi:hypothetical protein